MSPPDYGSFRAMDDLRPLRSGLAQALAEFVCKFLGRKRNCLRSPANNLREGFVDVAAGRQRRYLVAIWKLLNNGEGALADRAGRAEDGESFQRSTKSNDCNADSCLRSRLKPQSYDLSVPQHWSRQEQRVDAVKNAAVPR